MAEKEPAAVQPQGEHGRVVDDRWHELSVEECHTLLKRHHLGRVAIIDGGLPMILPVNYVIDDGSVVFRTDSGGMLDAATSHAPVAFEIDGIDEPNRAGWSVVVRGTADPVTDPSELTRLREIPLVPWAPGAKPNYVRVLGEQITGRRISVADLPSHWFG